MSSVRHELILAGLAMVSAGHGLGSSWAGLAENPLG